MAHIERVYLSLSLAHKSSFVPCSSFILIWPSCPPLTQTALAKNTGEPSLCVCPRLTPGAAGLPCVSMLLFPCVCGMSLWLCFCLPGHSFSSSFLGASPLATSQIFQKSTFHKSICLVKSGFPNPPIWLLRTHPPLMPHSYGGLVRSSKNLSPFSSNSSP